jgi:hypothetical protein
MVLATGNLVPLDVDLKETFQRLFNAAKKSTIALAKQAFEVENEA